MVEEIESATPAKAAAEDVAADLSAEIASQVEKEPSDRVSCRRIYENYYRCNWWAPADVNGYDNPYMGGLTVTTHRVRKSGFLRVTKAGDRLTISAR